MEGASLRKINKHTRTPPTTTTMAMAFPNHHLHRIAAADLGLATDSVEIENLENYVLSVRRTAAGVAGGDRTRHTSNAS